MSRWVPKFAQKQRGTRRKKRTNKCNGRWQSVMGKLWFISILLQRNELDWAENLLGDTRNYGDKDFRRMSRIECAWSGICQHSIFIVTLKCNKLSPVSRPTAIRHVHETKTRHSNGSVGDARTDFSTPSVTTPSPLFTDIRIFQKYNSVLYTCSIFVGIFFFHPPNTIFVEENAQKIDSWLWFRVG